MRILSILVFLVFVIEINSNEIVCNENNGNPRIKVAFRFDNYTVLVTTNDNVYRIENFKFKDQNFKFKQLVDISKDWNWIKGLKYAFPMPYNKNGTITRRVVLIMQEISEEIEQLFYYASIFDKNLTTIIDKDRVSLLLVKYKPSVDLLNLMTLFAKFPDQLIYDHIKTLLCFPWNYNTLGNFPFRFFVYYLETPTKQQIKAGNTGTKFKRHIMLDKRVYYGNDSEIDWRHDIKSGKCIDEKVIVNASFPLTDYRQSGPEWSFDIIEFSGDYYFVKRVYLTKDRVKTELNILKIGPIGTIFGCKTTLPDLPPEYVNSESTDALKEETSTTFAVMIWLTSIFLIILVIAILILIYEWRLQQQLQQTNQNNQNQ